VPALAAMERQGLIARARDTADRRKVNVYLTPRGRALRAALLPKAHDINARALRGLNERDLQQFMAVLGTIRDNLLELPRDDVLDDRTLNA
jgi:DNA-binding MarR family transcriptional regulator